MLSKRLETATKFVDHYATHDNEVLNTLLADDLIYEFAPSRSLDHMKPTDKAGYIELKQAMKLAMTGYPLDVKKYIEGEIANSKSFDLALFGCPIPVCPLGHYTIRPIRSVVPHRFPKDH